MKEKNILREAIDKLIKANHNLKDKLSQETDKMEIQKIAMEMAKNNSMILDYKFRLEYE